MKEKFKPDLIYWRESDQNYYMEKEGLSCELCQSPLNFCIGWAILTAISKKDFKNNYYCVSCFKEHKNEVCKLKIDELAKTSKLITINAGIPDNAVPVINWFPELSRASGKSNFNTSEIESDEVEDRTVYAGRMPILEGAKIGKDLPPPDEGHLGTVKELDMLLNDIKSAVAILSPSQEKLKLEMEKEKESGAKKEKKLIEDKKA